MKNLSSTGIIFKDEVLSLLDQQLLPQRELWVKVKTIDEMVAAVRALKVRGAPAIGVAASLFLASEAMRGKEREDLLEISEELRASRPTAVNLMNYMDRLEVILREGGGEWKESLYQEVENVFDEDVRLCESIAEHGLSVLPEKARVLTHCNTGSLATAGRGTALGVITKAHEEGQEIHVWVDETRPLLQGGRLTAWELEKAGVSHQLVCDNMAGALMSRGEVDCVIVGADRIATNGDFANKIGTYSLAVLANYHDVPFYVAAPVTTIDESCPNGKNIPIEERDPAEVRGFSSALGELYWAPESSPVFNPAFDVTPAELVSGWILDTGVKKQKDWK